jgi:hypothetical protein
LPRNKDNQTPKSQSGRVFFPAPNPIALASGYLILDLGGAASGGGNQGKYLYPTCGRSFVNVNGTVIEVNKLTADQMKLAIGQTIMDSTGHHISSGGGGVSTGDETVLDFVPATDLAPLIFPAFSPLDSLNPSFGALNGYMVMYGSYDSNTKIFSPTSQTGKSGEDRLYVLEVQEAPYLEYILQSDPFLKWLIAKMWAPGITIKVGSGTLKIPDLAAAYSGNVGQTSNLDLCYMLNHQVDDSSQSLLRSGYGLPWNLDPNSAPVSVGTINGLFVVNPLMGPPQVQQDFLKWQRSNCLPSTLLPWLNQNSHLSVTLSGTHYTVQLRFGPVLRGMATLEFYMVDDAGNEREIDAETVIESYKAVTDPADYFDQIMPNYGPDPLATLGEAAQTTGPVVNETKLAWIAARVKEGYSQAAAQKMADQYFGSS